MDSDRRATCTHLDTITDVAPSGNGCEDCERIGGHFDSWGLHFIPLLYIAALAAAPGESLDVLIDGPAYCSLSMTSDTLGGTA